MSPLGAVRLHRSAVCAQQIVRRDRGFETIAVTRSQSPMQVPTVGHDPGFVQRDPFLHAAVESTEHDRCVVGEPIRDFRIEPTATVIERGWKIPVIERDQRLDSILEQCVDQPDVEIEADGINSTNSAGQYPAPRNAEAVGLEA